MGTQTISESLSAQQRRSWVLQQLEQTPAAHHTGLCVRVWGSLDAGRLARAIHLVQKRHDILQSCFQMVDDEPRVVQCAKTCELVTIDSLPAAENNREQSALALIAAEQSKGFDLQAGLLIRPVLCRFASDESLLVVILHRIVCDRVSAVLLGQEIAAAYESISVGGEPLPSSVFQYAQHVRSQEEYRGCRAHGDDLA